MDSSSARHALATWPLLLGMGMLMLGAGLQGTLIGLRATMEGFMPFVTGVVMSCYYVGYIGGSVWTPVLLQRVGHIRVFAALTAVASVTILLQAAFVTPIWWGALRLVSGLCFAGIYVVAESWLNGRATNENRGTLLALYMLTLYGGLGGGQYLLTLADPAGPMLFLLISVTISLAVVPMSLSVQRAPEFEIPRKIRYREIYRQSPMGVVAVIISGVVTSSIFSMGPVYAQLSGLDPSEIATFMGVSILAAVITQLPIGRWSDRTDRRTVLIAICLIALVAAIAAAIIGTESKAILFILAAAFGGIALTLYSLSVSHINDHLAADEIVSASSAVVTLNGLGSIVGPLIVSLMMKYYGPPAYFFSLAGMLGTLVLYAAWRKIRRAAVPTYFKLPFINVQPQAVSGQMMAQVAHDAAVASADDAPHREAL
jgi:MFS family permease